MDVEAVSILHEIKWVLYVLSLLFMIGLGANCVRAYVSLKRYLRSENKDVFRKTADDLVSAGKFNDLIVLCCEQLRDEPNQPDAVWFLAKGYYHTGDFDKARMYFEQVTTSEPSWKAYAKAYVEEMDRRELL